MNYKSLKIFLPIILTLLTVLNAFAAKRADYLIIQNPAALKIYDRYQQELDTSEKDRLLSSAPLQIINKNELLGDQITESVHVRLGSRSDYFIIKDNNGKMLNEDRAGEIKKIKNAMVVNDSISIKKDNQITLKTSDSSYKLPAGSRLLRIFAYKNRYYVHQLAPRKRYGWITLNNSHAWEIIKQKEPSESSVSLISMELRTAVLSVFKTSNRLYKRYFDFFNLKTLKHETPPRWDVQFSGDIVQARFVPQSLLNDFKSSVAFTQRQLENVIIGTPYRITMQDSLLIIQKNGGRP